MKRILYILLAVMISAAVMAVPAKRGTVTITQPDGTTIEAELCGDEFFHYYVNTEGEMLEKNAEGFYVVRKEQLSQKQIQRARAEVQAKRSPSYVGRPFKPARGMAILVSFKDKSFTFTNQNFKDLLNKPGYSYNGATGSAADYFKSVSAGQYTPGFDVYGPYVLDQDMAFYGTNNANGTDSHPDQMVVDAVAKLAADASANVNFANYDADNDGYIDNIFIYYAGAGENVGAPEDCVWPHAWEVYPNYVTGQLVYNGKTIKGYACTCEMDDAACTTMCGIGTFCHEFGHILGLPDFYITDYNSSHKTLGNWDIMDAGPYLNNGNTPPTYSAHERFFLGWLKPEILNAAGTFSLEHIEKSNKAYIITGTGKHNLMGDRPDPATYYLLENRQNVGWDKYLPGHGLMITKTVFNMGTWQQNTPNNNRYTMGVDLIEADGNAPDNSQGKAGDLFPGTANVTHYEPFPNYPIKDIQEKDGVISFSFMNGTEGGTGGGDASEMFYETFDGMPSSGSVNVTSTMDDYADNLGWTGKYLYSNAKQVQVGSMNYPGYIITPPLNFNGTVTMVLEAYGSEASLISVSEEGYNASTKLSQPLKKESDLYSFSFHISKGARLRIEAKSGILFLNDVLIDSDPDAMDNGNLISVTAGTINPTQGSVKIILKAEPIYGFMFSHWSDGSTDNPRTIVKTVDSPLYAYFKPSEGTAIEGAVITEAKVYAKDNTLFVEGAESPYHVFDAAGRLIYSGRANSLSLQHGVYIIALDKEVQKIAL